MNIRIVFLFSLIFLCCFGRANADIPYNQYWTKANQFYTQKQYDSAAFYYEKIAETKPENATLYYNMGNAYYRLNNIGRSVLNYKRALKIDPGYTFAQDNLVLAQSRMQVKTAASKDIFFISWWKSLTRPTLSEIWAAFALLMFLSLLGILFWVRWKKIYDYKYRSLLYTCGLLFLFILVAAVVSANKRHSKNEAVVISPDAVFKTNVKNPKTETLSEGTIVECKEPQGDWISIQLKDGREGIVRIESIEKI